MRNIIIGAALLATAALAGAQDAPRPTPQQLFAQAREARLAGDYPGYLRAVEALKAMMPWSPGVTFNLTRAQALTGQHAAAVANLNALADAGWGFDAAGDEVLAPPMQGKPGFAEAAARLAANRTPHGTVTPSAKVALAGKQPEGVAATADGTLYVGALQDGIHRLDAGGLKRLYTPAAGFGVVGLRVDAPRNELIACLSDQKAGKGRLVRLALPDLAPRTSVDFPAENVFCNDSAVLPDGRVAVTDSTGGRLWIATRDRLAEVKTSTGLIYPNGIAYGGNRLYVAHAPGLLVVDPATGAATELKDDKGNSIIGIDGLIWHDGALLAVQNGTQPIRILRLTPAATSLRAEVLASGHSVFAGATTAAVAGGKLQIITQTGIPDGSKPDDPMLVEVPLAR
ncbi:SMP-30/gluconolactonase/LRE family protein [Sphingoaurantiacus capsulatus]|uniref:SMP-30/gluconolactonase/LRE family protein n=1 Tax=Sphingoaurantiacus capsulatus TaxID=1771310 RepID=A0ABV7X982_9SPHN